MPIMRPWRAERLQRQVEAEAEAFKAARPQLDRITLSLEQAAAYGCLGEWSGGDPIVRHGLTLHYKGEPLTGSLAARAYAHYQVGEAIQ